MSFRTYQMALELYRECESLKVPSHMRDQLLRAALSVCLNLAEGNGKPMGKDRRRFFLIAMGSLREVQCCLDLSGSEAIREKADKSADPYSSWLVPSHDGILGGQKSEI